MSEKTIGDLLAVLLCCVEEDLADEREKRSEQTIAAWDAIVASDTALRAVCNESNAVCACGCPESEHESYGEDGESCGVEGHECVRTSRSVAGMLARLRLALAEAEKERDEARRIAADLREMRIEDAGKARSERNAALARAEAAEAKVASLVSQGLAAIRRAESAESRLAEAVGVLRLIVTSHDARVTEKNVLVYGPPSMRLGTGFTEALEFLARLDEKVTK